MVNHNWAKVIRGSLNGVKEFGNVVKTKAAAGGTAGLALVAAHPVAAAFTVVAIVGVGLAIYYYTACDDKEGDLKYSNGKTDDDDPKGASDPVFYDPATKSVTDTPTTGSNIRNRKVVQSVSSTTKRKLLETPVDRENNLSISKASLTETSDNNLDIVDDKFLPHTGMSGERKVEEFIRNISEAHSIVSTVEDVEAYDSLNMHSVENLDENSSILSLGSISSSWSNVSSENLTTDESSVISYSSVGTVLSGDYVMCQACDEDNRNPVNTHNEPCHHRYVCDDCAKRIFKLFKRCKVCRARIEAIVLD